MKNKNIKNKPKKCGRWLLLHSRFSGPPYKGNTSVKPSKSFFNNNKQPKAKKKKKSKKKKKNNNNNNNKKKIKEKKKEPESPPPFKQSTRNLSLDYTEIEKRRRALGQYLFCVICNWAV